MRSSRLISIVAAAAVAVLAITPAAQAASSSATSTASSGADQCSLSVSKRSGAWICDGTASETAALRDKLDRLGLRKKARSATAQASSASAAVTPLSVPTSSYCPHTGACWAQYSLTDSDFYGTADYGYGTKPLGIISYYFEVKLNGAQTISKPVWFQSSRGLKQVTFEGERLYISAAHPEGNPVSPSTYSVYGPVTNVPAGAQTSWTPSGYKSYENTTQWVSVVHEVTWEDPSSSYPGHWHWYAKSIKAKRIGSGIYYFQGATALPTTPDKGLFNL